MWFEIIFSVIAVLGFLFNFLILYSVIKHRSLRKKSYVILVSLAVCDILKVVVIVDVIIYKSIDYHYDMCLSTSVLGLMLISATTLHLSFESVNRCLLILSPLTYDINVKKKTMAFFLAVIWFLPLLFSFILPLICFGDDWKHSIQFISHMFVCQEGKSGNTGNKTMIRTSKDTDRLSSMSDTEKTFLYLTHIIFFALPLLVMIVCYGLMLRLSYKSAQRIRKSEVSVADRTIQSPAVTRTDYSNPIIQMVASTYDTSVVSNDLRLPGQITHEERAGSVAKLTKEIIRLVRVRKRELKAGRTVLIIILAFIICNSPIFFVTWRDMRKIDKDTSTMIRETLVGVAFVQVFIDPVIYFLRLKDYKNIRKKCKKFGNSAIRKTRKTFRRF